MQPRREFEIIFDWYFDLKVRDLKDLRTSGVKLFWKRSQIAAVTLRFMYIFWVDVNDDHIWCLDGVPVRCVLFPHPSRWWPGAVIWWSSAPILPLSVWRWDLSSAASHSRMASILPRTCIHTQPTLEIVYLKRRNRRWKPNFKHDRCFGLNVEKYRYVCLWLWENISV